MTANGENVERPHMECSARSRTMADILRHMGYEADEAVIAADRKGYLDHVVIDVWHPDLQKMMMFDTTYNVYVKDSRSGDILGLREILETPLENLIYCEPDGTCSPDNGTRRVGNRGVKLAHLPPYYGNAFLYSYNDDESKRGPVLYNPKRFNMDGQQEVEGEMMTYCEKRPDWCAAKGVVEVQTKR